MSVNISLADTPGVSAFFDGQPIQDELEAEIRREEQRQEKELRDLLATELEDFEDDFLSDSNSDEDSVNVSRTSRASSHHRARQNESLQEPSKASRQMLEVEQDGDNRNRKQSDCEPYFSPSSQRNPTIFQTGQGPLGQQQQATEHLKNQSVSHPYPFNQQQEKITLPQVHGEDSDEWMMRIQSQSAAVSSAAPYYQPPHNQPPHHQPPQRYHTVLPQSLPDTMENSPMPLSNHLHHIQPFHGQATKLMVPSMSISSKHAVSGELPPLPSTAPPSLPSSNPEQNREGLNEYDNYQVQYKMKLKSADVNENDFYIENENVEFFKAGGGEEQRSYQQLEILYGARGREMEQLTWKLGEAEEAGAKDVRMYKHKLALATAESEGAQDSLRHCQSLLQKAKSELADSHGLVKSLELQVSTLKEGKEELIKKLQVAESTIENLSHQCEELQQSESLSRARNEHEAVVASLTQRFERELFTIKEKWDETRTNLSTKHDEIVWLKKQLAESTKELEQAQISRGETINRLARSLEDSQRQCQTLLEHSSSQEVASLKVKLQQTVACKSISDDMCIGLQSEIKELKEQMSMFESASSLGVFASGVASTNHKNAGPSLDDSMTDLGIKKTLDFDTPHSTPKIAETSSLEDLVTSLRSELERCLSSNRQKRSEIAEKLGDIQNLKQELNRYQDKNQDLEKICSSQKSRLTDLESLMSNTNGESIVEAKLRRDLDAIVKEKAILLEDIEDYKKRIEEVGASEAKLTEINTELSAQIAQMVTDSDADKTAALDRCQRTLEEVHSLTIGNLRSELENRLTSEKNMLAECHRNEMERLQGQIASAQEEAHTVKALYVQTCEEMKKQEETMKSAIRQEVEEELTAVWNSKEQVRKSAAVQDEENKRTLMEETFQREKHDWKQKKEMFDKEINASKDLIAELKAAHDKEKSDMQETISDMRSQHEKEEKCLEEKLANIEAIHQSELKKAQEEKERNALIDEEKSNLDVLEKQYKLEKEELEKTVRELQLKLEEECTSKTEQMLPKPDMKEISVQTDHQVEDQEECHGESARNILGDRESELHLLKEKHASMVEDLKSEHRKEFEKAARNREEKFQSELRYFLKDKEEKVKEKLEEALKKKEEETVRRIKERDLKHEDEIERLKNKYNSVCGDASSKATEMSREIMEEKIEKLLEEKSKMEEKMKNLEQEKKEEILSLMDKHAQEEKGVIEKYTKEIELSSQKHEQQCALLQEKLEELKEAERSGSENRDLDKIVTAKVQEERGKWFKEAQEYIHSEIEVGLKAKLASQSDSLNESVRERSQEMEGEINTKVQERLQNEIDKLNAEKAEMMNKNEKIVNSKVKQKMSVEVENLKIKFLSELEARVEKEKAKLAEDVKKWKDEMKIKIEDDKDQFVSGMSKEIEVKVCEEKKKIEEAMKQEREEDMKEMRKELEEEMRRRIEKEKRDWQKELKKREGNGKDDDIAWRERLQVAENTCAKALKDREQALELMKKRESTYKEDKQKMLSALKEFRQELNKLKEENVSLEEQYAEMDKRYKEDMKDAKRRRDQALEELATKANQEKEELMKDFKKRICSMKEEYSTEMDRLRTEAEVDRAAALMEVRSHTERALTLSPLQEPDTETTTLFELRDHYLETVAKIKEDVMGHVQAANSRAASTMKTEMRKQRRRLIQVFKQRCKVSIHSIVSGEVSPMVLSSLDSAIDAIADAMVTTPKTSKSPSDPSTPRSDSNAVSNDTNAGKRTPHLDTRSNRADANTGLEKLNDREFVKGNSVTPVYSRRQENQRPSRSVKTHPQLDKVDLYDSEAAGSSPLTSSHSSPAAAAPRSRLCPYNNRPDETNMDTRVPPLDLSPFHSNQYSKYASPLTENQRSDSRYKESSSTFKGRQHISEEPALTSKSRRAGADTRQGSKSKHYADDVVDSKSSKDATDDTLTSPRERMKMIEARVRLANWAASGEMPWKAGAAGSRPEQEHEISSTSDPRNPGGLYSRQDRAKRMEGDDNEDGMFLKPGIEAERFVMTQKSMKRRDDGLITPSKVEKGHQATSSHSHVKNVKPHHYVHSKAAQNRPTEHDGYSTDDSNASKESHRIFVTLEPDPLPRLPGNSHVQVSRGKYWDTNTSDYDRIKAAVFDNSMGIKGFSGQAISSDEDGISVGSDDVPHFAPLPTSTPAEKGRLHQKNQSHSEPARLKKKSDSGKHSSFSKISSKENESEDWKTVDALFTFSGNEYDNAPLKRDHCVAASKSKSAEVAKATNFEFADLSEITHASDDVHQGRGMWRYKSLEDLLPQQGKNMEKDTGDLKKRSRDRSAGRAPVQAMDSEFWQRQSLEDDEDCREGGDTQQREMHSLPHHQPYNYRSLTTGHSDGYCPTEDNRYYASHAHINSKRTKDSKHLAATKPSSDEPVLSKKYGKNNMTSSSTFSSSPYISQRPSRASPTPHTKFDSLQKSSYSPQFDAHVEDLRKSLETMERNAFSSKKSGSNKSNMKRSVSEQSLHTIQWDHSLQTDVEDLVTAYTSGGVAQSHFDLHTFGYEEEF